MKVQRERRGKSQGQETGEDAERGQRRRNSTTQLPTKEEQQNNGLMKHDIPSTCLLQNPFNKTKNPQG
jgi:hypothetical protein